ncbi:MAG: hypothetical protein R3202_11095 [Candidatus Competibacterales bacterium]|nr:hypothetical protein [Candidatus Competibacterales bacterium]
MRFHIGLLLVLLALQLQPVHAGIEPTDAARIVDTLLDLERPSDNPLQDYHAWEALYLKYAERAREADADGAAVKIYLLVGLVARQTLDAGLMEAFATDLLPIYERHERTVLEALRQTPVLLEPTCNYLGRYFGFEDRNREYRVVFLERHTDTIREILASDGAEACLRHIGDRPG